MLLPRLVRYASLGSSHVPTGHTRHYRNGELLPTPSQLQIVQFPGDASFYLLYLDQHGHEMTDTWHATVEDAMNQAEREFRIRPAEWCTPAEE